MQKEELRKILIPLAAVVVGRVRGIRKEAGGVSGVGAGGGDRGRAENALSVSKGRFVSEEQN